MNEQHQALSRAVTRAERAISEGEKSYEEILLRLIQDAKDVMTELALSSATHIRNEPTLTKALRIVCCRYGIKASEVLSRQRSKRISRARGAVAWLSYRAGLSSVEIGIGLGRNHSTVLYMINRTMGAADEAELKALESEMF